jgi:hypothetical protein
MQTHLLLGNTCAADTFSSATWTATDSLTDGSGTCVAGFSGSPRRACLFDGAWSTTVINPCTRTGNPGAACGPILR